MKIEINQPIVGYEVAGKGEPEAAHEAAPPATLPTRPDMLFGSTYKIQTPLSEHALYVTINDLIQEDGNRSPFEVFINSKNMDHFQWIVALTRVISAVFRHGGDPTFLVEELRSVFDPKGGYFKRGGKYMPSLVAEIGDAINSHLVMIGVIEERGLDEHQQRFVDEKRAECEESSYPPEATLCPKCNTKAVILMDGCATCLNCGDSKCG